MRGRDALRGLTLVEVMITLLVLGTITSSVALLVRSTVSSLGAVTAASHNEVLARRALARAKAVLQDSGLATVAPRPSFPAWDTWVECQRCVGEAAGVPVWGPLERLALRPDPQDPTDGVDNDGDQLIDEGELVWIQRVGTPTEHTTVLARGVALLAAGEAPNGVDDNGNGLVDEPGLCFTLEGATLTARLTLERSAHGGAVTRAAYSTTVLLQGD